MWPSSSDSSALLDADSNSRDSARVTRPMALQALACAYPQSIRQSCHASGYTFNKGRTYKIDLFACNTATVAMSRTLRLNKLCIRAREVADASCCSAWAHGCKIKSLQA